MSFSDDALRFQTKALVDCGVLANGYDARGRGTLTEGSKSHVNVSLLDGQVLTLRSRERTIAGLHRAWGARQGAGGGRRGPTPASPVFGGVSNACVL